MKKIKFLFLFTIIVSSLYAQVKIYDNRSMKCFITIDNNKVYFGETISNQFCALTFGSDGLVYKENTKDIAYAIKSNKVLRSNAMGQFETAFTIKGTKIYKGNSENSEDCVFNVLGGSIYKNDSESNTDCLVRLSGPVELTKIACILDPFR